MLNLTFYLLDNGEDRYMNADVLWITDFLIPRTTEDLMKRFKDYQATGTKFYGFKIGQAKAIGTSILIRSTRCITSSQGDTKPVYFS